MNDAYAEAREHLGTWEWKDGHNPKIVQWFSDVGHAWVKDDETAWCAAFVGAMLKAGGFAHTGKLNARSYVDYGEHVDPEDAQPGDIVIFWRDDPTSWKGHVGFYVRKAHENIIVLGGNQGNQVSEQAYAANRLLAVRRPVKQRTSKAQSTTLQATAAAGVSGAGGVATAISALDGTAQLVVIGAAVIAALALAWIARERIKKWARGDR